MLMSFGGGVQDGAIAERVDEARDAAGVAVDVGLGVIGEDRGGTTTASGVVVDVAAGLLQGHGRHVVGDADALASGCATCRSVAPACSG